MSVETEGERAVAAEAAAAAKHVRVAIVVRRLLNDAWTRHRRDGRPTWQL